MRGAFERWCVLTGVIALPAPPAAVAAFIKECGTLGADRVWQALQEVSRAHRQHGYADPTLGGPAAQAMNELSQIEPPRSWPKEARQRFLSLPYDLQLYTVRREAERDRAVNRAQNAAAAARKVAEKGTIS